MYTVQVSMDETLVMGDVFNRNRFMRDVLTSFQVSIIICYPIISLYSIRA
jgi:hypothetical protein